MNLESTLVGIIIVIVCVLVFVIINRSSKNRNNQFLSTLFKTAETNACKISQFDHWANSAIGIDEVANRLFFVKKTNEQAVTQQINLAEVSRCYVLNANRSAGVKNEMRIVDKLELAFAFENKKKSDAVFEFYNAEYDSLTLRGELQLIEKWSKIANDAIALTARKTER